MQIKLVVVVVVVVVTWLAPRAGKMSQILCCDWIPDLSEEDGVILYEGLSPP